MKNINDYAQDFATVWAAMDRVEKLFEETGKQMAETKKQMAESSAKVDKQIAETQKKMAESSAKVDKQIAESNARTDKQIAESNARLDEKFDRTDKLIAATTANIDKYLAELKEARKDIGGISSSNGMFAESYFFESLKRSKQFGGINYDVVGGDLTNTVSLPNGEQLDAQFDIVMFNCDSVAIIEVKYKVKQDDVKILTNRKLEDFKKLFIQYTNYKFYLGVAGFSFEKRAVKEAIKRGVGMLKLVGENLEIEDKHLRIY